MIHKEKKKLLQKASLLSLFILINKPVGFLRDILQNRYFGIGILSDAYITAWRIPNIFRRIFGEGLLSNVLLPHLIEIKKQHPNNSSLIEEVITAISIILQGIIIIICSVIAWNSQYIINLLSPGDALRAMTAGPFLSILIFFVFFMVFSALLTIPLQLKNNFYTGPQSQFLINIALCLEFYFGWKYQWTPNIIMYITTANGIIISGFCLFMYKKYQFSFLFPSRLSIKYTFSFFKHFFMALFSSLFMEGSTLFSLSLSSYLKTGILSFNEILLTLIRIPQQIFGSALSTVSNIELTENIILKSNTLSEQLRHINSLLFYMSFLTSCGIFIFGKIFFSLFFYLSGFPITNQLLSSAHTYLFYLSLTLYPALLSKIMTNIIYAHKKIIYATSISFITLCIQNIFLYYTITTYQLNACIISYILGDIIRFVLLFTFLKKKYQINIYHSYNKTDIKFFFKFIFYLFIMNINLYHILKKLIPTSIPFYSEIIRCIIFIFIVIIYRQYHKKKQKNI